MNREEINEYDLGLPVPIAPLEERRCGVPPTVWAALRRLEARLVTLFGPRLQKLTLFGSYARNQFDEESDVDVLVLLETMSPGERERIVDEAVRCSTSEIVLSPLILTTAQLDALRARERLIALDIDREGIAV
jgi:uncharacterized protein